AIRRRETAPKLNHWVGYCLVSADSGTFWAIERNVSIDRCPMMRRTLRQKRPVKGPADGIAGVTAGGLLVVVSTTALTVAVVAFPTLARAVSIDPDETLRVE